MAGEETHEAGAEGARRAKVWLERTTRAEARWVTPDPTAVPKLTFPWQSNRDPFSFDLGGLLRGGALSDQQFLVESKFYKDHGAQGTMYKEFLAKCYCALLSRPQVCDHFFWITWAPFSVTKWSQLDTEPFILQAVLDHREDSLNLTDLDDAEAAVDHKLIKTISERLWLIVLSRRQERELVMSKEHLALIRQHEVQNDS